MNKVIFTSSSNATASKEPLILEVHTNVPLTSSDVSLFERDAAALFRDRFPTHAASQGVLNVPDFDKRKE